MYKPKPKPERTNENCNGCGDTLTEYAIFVGHCPNCKEPIEYKGATPGPCDCVTCDFKNPKCFHL